jgi:hypothetical protein
VFAWWGAGSVTNFETARKESQMIAWPGSSHAEAFGLLAGLWLIEGFIILFIALGVPAEPTF